jgi:hypothetical protein
MGTRPGRRALAMVATMLCAGALFAAADYRCNEGGYYLPGSGGGGGGGGGGNPTPIPTATSTPVSVAKE